MFKLGKNFFIKSSPLQTVLIKKISPPDNLFTFVQVSFVQCMIKHRAHDFTLMAYLVLLLRTTSSVYV